MDRFKYAISGGLDGNAIGKIRDDAFELLERVGVEIPDGEVLTELAAHNGVRVEGPLVFYSHALVERFVSQVRRENDEYMLNVPDRMPRALPPFLCRSVWDLEHDRARPATTEDLARAVSLLDTYGVEGVPPVHPQDVPENLRQVVTAKVSYEHSAGIGSYLQATSVREAEILCRMGQAAGRSMPHVSLQIVHSPLKLDTNSLRLVVEMRKSGRTPRGVTVGGGAMPLAGAAAPLLPPGFLAQGLAEAIAAYGTAKLLNDRVGGYCSMFPGTFDMRYSGLSMGCAEQIFYWLAVRQVIRDVFGQTMGADFACTGKTYDAQTGAQKMAAALTGVLSGATTFANVGMTPTDEVFHFEGAVIDMEILAYAWRVGRGMGWEETPTADIVRHGRAEGTFMTHPTTMRFRDEIWDPAVFTNENLAQWTAEGSPPVLERAARIAEERIKSHAYRPQRAVQVELDRLLEIAKAELP